MTPCEISQYRLCQQQIVASHCRTPTEVVATLGAMQAQDYPGGLWAIGLRQPNCTEQGVEKAITERTIVRTWPMRGTLHFVTATDVRWMLALLTPRIIAGTASRARDLELDDHVFARCGKLFVRALTGGRQLTREAMMDLLEANKIVTAQQRGYHILWRLAQAGVIVFAARVGKSHTFALLEEWLPAVKSPAREAALTELARRYFTSHGPATLTDFAGWSGLKVTDARAGIEGATRHLRSEKLDGVNYWLSATATLPCNESPTTHLLPGFDEFILGYKDRSAVLAREHAKKIIPGGNGMFMPTIIVNSRVVGTWKRTLKKDHVAITTDYFKPVKKAEKKALATTAEQYSTFMARTGPPIIKEA